jgi:hypothetical protein
VGAPADDDHVPWPRPPWRGHLAADVLAGHGAGWPAPALGRPVLLSRSGRGPGSGPKSQQGWAGAEELEAAEGLTNLNFCQDHRGQVRVSNNTQTGGPDRRTGPRPGPRHGLRPSGRVRRGIEYRHKNVQIRVVGTPQVTFGAEVRPAPAPTRLGGHPTR